MEITRTETADGTVSFDYSGLGFVLPPGSGHDNPQKKSLSWDLRFHPEGVDALVVFSWMGDNQVGEGLDFAGVDDLAAKTSKALEEKGWSVARQPITVQGAREATSLTWVEPATEDTRQEFPGIDRFACTVAMVLGKNGYYYEATYCFGEGDAAAEAMVDESIKSLRIDVDYPGNRER
ncbi:MAG: hypothetical protein Q4D89_06660 [Arachnia propionica]|uniref:hypothetical protein n=1 Tax=Arachnia propionica TaxID=1750 RepID=UPI002710BB95|nr:hypothetical protein [Arachnia propionica]